MGIDVKIEHKSNYIHLKCEGGFKLSDMLEVFDKAFSLASGDHPTAILLDVREISGDPPTTERFFLGESIAKRWMDNRKQNVFAAIGNEPLIDPKRFVETVAKNRGFPFRAFTDFDEAVSWLEIELKKKKKSNEK